MREGNYVPLRRLGGGRVCFPRLAIEEATCNKNRWDSSIKLRVTHENVTSFLSNQLDTPKQRVVRKFPQSGLSHERTADNKLSTA